MVARHVVGTHHDRFRSLLSVVQPICARTVVKPTEGPTQQGAMFKHQTRNARVVLYRWE